MENNGYVVTICILSSAFCYVTPYFIFLLYLLKKGSFGKKSKENLGFILFGAIPFGTYFTGAIMLNTVCGELINTIPFWMKIVTIIILSFVNSFEFIVSMCLMEKFPKCEQCGGWNATPPKYDPE